MNLQSLGHAAGIYQQDPRVIRAGLAVVQAHKAAAAGKPLSYDPQAALVLNGVEYFDADEITSAIADLAERDAKRMREAGVNV
jgi:hypothetical protein